MVGGGQARAERFCVEVSGTSGLRLVSNCEEWASLRREVRVACGSVGAGAVEADMIDALTGVTRRGLLM